jgi:putative N6-adenine-specific DNA methylase
LPYFVTAARGTEGLLKAELRELGIRPIEGDRGGIHFGGSLEDAFRVCLWSRIGVRVLERRFETEVRSDRELYEAVYAHDVTDLLEPSRSLAVTAMIKNSYADHSQFVARRVKDAIVDRQRDVLSRRSNVSAENPDVHFLVRLNGNTLSIYADLSGEPLHRRGYRAEAGVAPIKENLAASLLRLGGYDGKVPMIDPCCGSGTILCEAWLMAHNRAPGLGRMRFGLERFARVGVVEQRGFRDSREAARACFVKESAAPLIGSDIDIDALDRAKQAIRRLGGELALARRDVLQAVPSDEVGLVVTNPPYGVRLQGGEPFDRRLAAALRRWEGHRVVVLTQEKRFADYFGMRPAFEHSLMNGDLDCRAFGWDLGRTTEG